MPTDRPRLAVATRTALRTLVPGLLAVALLIVPSSPISAGESPADPDDDPDPDVGSVFEVGPRGEVGEDVTPVATADLRAAIEARAWDEALDLLRRRIALDPAGDDAPELRLVQARVLDRMGREWDSIRIYRRLLDDPVLGARALAELHDRYLRSGRFEAADRLTEPAVDAPPDPLRLRLRAHAREVQGRFSEARAVASDPVLADDPAAALVRANSTLALGDPDEAARLYVDVLRVASEPAVRQAAHFGLGQVERLRGGRAGRALQDERALRLGPFPAAALDRALALRALDRHAEARAQLERVVDEEPPLASTAHLVLARLEETEGLVDRALGHLADAIEGSVGDFLAYARLGDLLLETGREEPGIEALRESLEIFPQFPPARERLARALAARGRWEEAPAPADSTWSLPDWTWDRLLDGDLPYHRLVTDRDSIPVDDPRRVVLALVQLRAGFPAAALAWSEGCEPGGGVLAVIRAEALERCGRLRDAHDAWRAILAVEPENGVALERLADLLQPTEPEAARTLRADLLRTHPDRVRARLRVAARLEEMGDLEAAVAAYRAARDAGWLTETERRRVRVAIEDLESLIRERDEERIGPDSAGVDTAAG